jgi:hypothetical protein
VQCQVWGQTQHLWAAFLSSGTAPWTAVAEEPAEAAAAASTSTLLLLLLRYWQGMLAKHGADTPAAVFASTSNNKGSSSASQQVKWGYLLRLQQCSRRWAASLAAYEANQPSWYCRSGLIA